MAKIPSAESKNKIKFNWYKQIPADWIQQSFKEIIEQTDGIKKRKRLNKRQIYLLIQKHGLPDFANMEDYNQFIDDPTIYQNDQVRDVNVDLD